MLLMMLLGIPIYVCATASVPMAWALIDKGVSPGAALVFLMTGPATNAATIATIWKVMGRRTAIIYLATVALSALAAGLALDYVFDVTGVSPEPAAQQMLPDVVKWTCAVVLLGVLGLAMFGRGGRPAQQIEPSRPATVRLAVKGMTCSHCAASVRRALLACPGVEAAEVDLAGGRAVVTGSAADVGILRQAVEELGYDVTEVRDGSASGAARET